MQYALNSISIGLERNISKTAGDRLETPFKMSTNRKWRGLSNGHAYAVRSTILATAWLLVII